MARGYDLETEIRIRLEDVLAGTEADVEFTRLDVCQTCTGSGARPGSKPQRCAACGGHGKVAQAGLGGMFRMVTTCAECHGSGEVIVDKCETCRGKGRVPRTRRLAVRIPPGIHDGQAVRVPAEGEPPPREVSPDGSGVRGDLHVVVRVEEHEIFRRQDDHLLLDMPLSFTQAALGAEVDVPVLTRPDGDENGRQTQGLAIPRGTQHGALFRIPGEGLPNLRSGRRGDLAVVVRIEIPRRLTRRQEELLREFAATEDHDVLPERHGFFKKIRDFLAG